MGGFRGDLVCAAGALFLFCLGCANTTIQDLSQNDSLYRYTGYRARVPADRVVFVTPVTDTRDAVQPADAQGPYPIQYMPDGVWAQPPAGMVDAILRRELDDSAVFAEVQERAAPESCVLQVAVEEFAAGIEENMRGRRSLAIVRLRATVLGPAGATGGRQKLFEEAFDGNVRTDVTMRPISPKLLVGGALGQAMTKLLSKLDQSNVARAHAPLGVR